MTLAELEQVLLQRRREERLRRLHERGIERELPELVSAAPGADLARMPTFSPRRQFRGSKPPAAGARLLTVVELLALVGFVVAGVLWYRDTQGTDLTGPTPPLVAEAEERAPEVPAELPGNPAPPAEAGAIPPIYQAWIKPETSDRVPLQGELSEQRPTRIVIPKMNVDAPVVQGMDWEALKRGAGHAIGSANPGERGNMVISAHNDVFGELFRHLDQLEPGDQFTVYDALNGAHTYIVRTRRIVKPTEVSVLAPSPEPLATLISCYPYLVDSQRLIVQAELVR